jgi:hypothetical protein
MTKALVPQLCLGVSARLHPSYVSEIAMDVTLLAKQCLEPLGGWSRASRLRSRQNARWTSGFGSSTFIFYSQTEKLIVRFRVLARNCHLLAPPRRDHVVDSTFVRFPYGQTCLNTGGARYLRRGGSPNYCLVLRRQRIP